MRLLYELRCLKPTIREVVAMVQRSTRNPSFVDVKSERVVSGPVELLQGPCAWMYVHSPPPPIVCGCAPPFFFFLLALKLNGDGESAFPFEAMGFSR